MLVYRGCAFPEDLLYDVAQDVWVRWDEASGLATLGMTDPAQSRSGKLVTVHFKPIGRVVQKGKTYATIESAKWVGGFPAVLSGELVETNETTFRRDMLIANRDPYGEGWLVKIRPTRWEEKDALLDAAAAFLEYQKKIEAWNISCMRCID
jgi:glycine cleavage system H protein